MPKAARKKTVSDEPLEQRIYEEAARDEETFLMLQCGELLDEMPTPRGWGVPREGKRGPKELFGWRGLVLALLLKTFHKMTYRETTSHLRANPELCARMGLPRAPSPKTMMRALDRIPEAWWRHLNRLLVGTDQRGAIAGGMGERPPASEPVWIVLD